MPGQDSPGTGTTEDSKAIFRGDPCKSWCQGQAKLASGRMGMATAQSIVEIPGSAAIHRTSQGGCHNSDRPQDYLNYIGSHKIAQEWNGTKVA